MTPDRFLQKLLDLITMIKVPAVIIICVISLIQVLSATFVGGYDKKAIFSTLFYADKFVLWMSTFIAR